MLRPVKGRRFGRRVLREGRDDFGVPAAVIASVILILSYAVLFSEKLNRAVAVMLGAAAMVLLGVLSYDQALKGIDFNTIALLIGMMIMVGIMENPARSSMRRSSRRSW